MSDISKCTGIDCPLKEKCYRYTCIPNEYHQSYFMEVPYNSESNECEFKLIQTTNTNESK